MSRIRVERSTLHLRVAREARKKSSGRWMECYFRISSESGCSRVWRHLLGNNQKCQDSYRLSSLSFSSTDAREFDTTSTGFNCCHRKYVITPRTTGISPILRHRITAGICRTSSLFRTSDVVLMRLYLRTRLRPWLSVI